MKLSDKSNIAISANMAYRDVHLMPEGEGEEEYENLEMILKPATDQSMADNETAEDSVYETICACQPAAEMPTNCDTINKGDCVCNHGQLN